MNFRLELLKIVIFSQIQLRNYKNRSAEINVMDSRVCLLLERITFYTYFFSVRVLTADSCHLVTVKTHTEKRSIKSKTF